MNGKYKVAIDGVFVAEFDSKEKAEKYKPGETADPAQLTPAKEIPIEVPEDVNFGDNYESIP